MFISPFHPPYNRCPLCQLLLPFNIQIPFLFLYLLPIRTPTCCAYLMTPVLMAFTLLSTTPSHVLSLPSPSSLLSHNWSLLSPSLYIPALRSTLILSANSSVSLLSPHPLHPLRSLEGHTVLLQAVLLTGLSCLKEERFCFSTNVNLTARRVEWLLPIPKHWTELYNKSFTISVQIFGIPCSTKDCVQFIEI